MPTPVDVARQCLTSEASHALDEAVAVARRRGHAQTTSLHAISALLSLTASPLRDACARARNIAYSPRLQFKALDLCLGVSLDRVPSIQLTESKTKNVDSPPVSNSLMAAIKRSQANQRRLPENYHLYHSNNTQTTSSSSISCVKVELQHFILSILDDPVVSRVFGEAGFRSSEIKLAIIRPLPQLLRYNNNLNSSFNPRLRGPPMFLCNFNNNNNNNPIDNRSLMSDPGQGFDYCNFRKRIGEVLINNEGRNPLLVGACAYDTLTSYLKTLQTDELSFKVVCIENEIKKVVTFGDSDEGLLRFDQVGKVLEDQSRVVVNYGDLKVFLTTDENEGSMIVKKLVEQLTNLLQVYNGKKVRLIGCVANYDTYLKFMTKFPSIERDWELQLLPITSSSNRPSSLMESFVPFGGFFPTTCEFKIPSISNSSNHCATRCHLCNQKCEQEVVALSNGFYTDSVADQYQSCLPSWLQMTEHSTNDGLDTKIRDDGMVLRAKVAGLQNKWDKICSRLHPRQSFNSYQTGFQYQTALGCQFLKDKMGTIVNESPTKKDFMDLNSRISVNQQNIFTSESEQRKQISKGEDFLFAGIPTPSSLSNSSVDDGNQTSPTLVTTELGLGIRSSPENQTHSSSSSCLDSSGQNNSNNFKELFKALSERVTWQDEAISVISQTIANNRMTCHARNSRKGTWFNFSGPDRHGKREIAVSLAEIICGSKENFIYADLSCQDVIYNLVAWESSFRGKTVVDYVVEELRKKPLSIVFLENIDKADMLGKSSISLAIKTGKLSDSHGREVGINNAIFVTTSSISEENRNLSSKNYSEEMILNKRKLLCVNENTKRAHRMNLDLNLPAQENEAIDGNFDENDKDATKSWLEDFNDQMVTTVVFKSFDFNILPQKIIVN
ncbi:hypothetical protein ACFE04_003201 [Oxalis oulophora]